MFNMNEQRQKDIFYFKIPLTFIIYTISFNVKSFPDYESL